MARAKRGAEEREYARLVEKYFRGWRGGGVPQEYEGSELRAYRAALAAHSVYTGLGTPVRKLWFDRLRVAVALLGWMLQSDAHIDCAELAPGPTLIVRAHCCEWCGAGTCASEKYEVRASWGREHSHACVIVGECAAGCKGLVLLLPEIHRIAKKCKALAAAERRLAALVLAAPAN
jgi:hypothetical protein